MKIKCVSKYSSLSLEKTMFSPWSYCNSFSTMNEVQIDKLALNLDRYMSLEDNILSCENDTEKR